MNNILLDGGIFIMLCGIVLWWISRRSTSNIVLQQQYSKYTAIVGTIFVAVGFYLVNRVL